MKVLKTVIIFMLLIQTLALVSCTSNVKSKNGVNKMPIQNVDKLDIMGVRKDGKGIDLVIVSSSHLDSSPDTQKLVLDKVEKYLSYVNSEEFKQKIGKFDSENIIIKLTCVDDPDPIMKDLFKKIEPWVEKSGARFVVEVKE